MNWKDKLVVVAGIFLTLVCGFAGGMVAYPLLNESPTITIEISVAPGQQTFQGQSCIYDNAGGVLQRCAGGQWVYFPDPELRWTDGNLWLITGVKYEGQN
jgi:hypothetical protein